MQIRIRISHRPKPLAPVEFSGNGDPSRGGSTPDNPQPPSKSRLALGGSSRVALGILGSRLTGLARERFIVHYFGIETVVADALRAAIRIPNLLGNLFGEGVLSASFVTVYSKLRAMEQDEEAEHVAAAVFGILSIVCSVLVLLGIFFTPVLIDLIVAGFTG